MKFRSLYKFNDLENKENFIFFAQLLEEMLFDYTLDTYKPSILNIHSLIEEAFDVIREVENGNIKGPNITHILSELVSNLEKDIIANAILSLPKHETLSILKNKKEHENLGKIKNTLKILELSLNRTRYKNQLEGEIILHLENKEENFKEIRTLTRSYITFLVSNGYNTKYIRKHVLDFFWSNDNKFNSIKNIQQLFDIFSFKYKNYNVFFVADDILSTYHLPDNSDTKLIYIYGREELPNAIQDKSFLRINSGLSFYSMKCKALDPFSARERVEKELRIFSNLINIFHHKKSINWHKKFIVIEDETDISIIVNEPVKSMHKCIDLKENKARSQLQDFLKSFHLESESFDKFINSVRLHSMAIHTDSHENQLLNLWVSLESLIPEDTKSNEDSNIEHIIKSVIPFLNMYYFYSLVNKLIKDLVRWDLHLTRRILRDIPGNDLITKVIKILSNSDYEQKFSLLNSKTRDFHLLRDRIQHFKKLFSSKKNMNDAILLHTQRLEWQIRRIYRTRNLIVHTGITPKYTPILIEHTHSYLDVILSTLIKLSSMRKIQSVAQGFQYMWLIYNDYLRILQDKNNSGLDNTELDKMFKYLNG